MTYDFGATILPGPKNFDCGECSMSVLDTEPSIYILPKYTNIRGYPAVKVFNVKLQYTHDGQLAEKIIIFPTGFIYAELDQAWSSFGNGRNCNSDSLLDFLECA